MTTPMSRRALFAQLLLTGSPRSIYERHDGDLSVEFDTIADLHAWMTEAGLNGPDVLISKEYTGEDDGRRYRTQSAYPQVGGRTVYAHAREYLDTPPLAADVHDRLSDLAGAVAT